jgi:HK97 family phage prohead protease
MNRNFFLDLDSARARRTSSDRPIEVRASQSGDTLIWDGYGSVTNHSYSVFGGPPYGWDETVQRGAYKRTLLNNADVSFLINHEGMSLARTRSGTLTLDEDDIGLRNVVELDMRQNAVNDLAIANERGDVNEQSIGFRVVGDEWFDENGEPSNRMVGTKRNITEINMNKGDVSAVNYGANDAASGGFRDLDVALSELRSGKALTDDQRSLIRSFAAAIDDTTPPERKAPSSIAARLAMLELV